MSIVSAVNTVLSPIISWGVKHLGRLVVQAVPVDIHFCAPPKDDGYGGHIGGSYAIFTLEVINRKQAPVSLTDICCQAFCNDQLLEGGIQCFNNDKHSVSAQARKYQKISILDTLGENSQRCLIFYTGADTMNTVREKAVCKHGEDSLNVIVVNRAAEAKKGALQ